MKAKILKRFRPLFRWLKASTTALCGALILHKWLGMQADAAIVGGLGVAMLWNLNDKIETDRDHIGTLWRVICEPEELNRIRKRKATVDLLSYGLRFGEIHKGSKPWEIRKYVESGGIKDIYLGSDHQDKSGATYRVVFSDCSCSRPVGTGREARDLWLIFRTKDHALVDWEAEYGGQEPETIMQVRMLMACRKEQREPLLDEANEPTTPSQPEASNG